MSWRIPNKEPARRRRRYENRVMSWRAELNSSKEVVLYVCNPTSKEWISLRPIGCDMVDSFGLAFYPSGTSVNKKPCFKLVGIQRSEVALIAYSFVMYSSETGKWITSQEVCHCQYRIHKNKEVLIVGNRFYWLTWNYHINTFDAKRELSGIVELPGPVMEGEQGTVMEGEGWREMCLGSSDGYFHYVYVNSSEVLVWMLEKSLQSC